MNTKANIDEYINDFPAPVQKLLQQVRTAIKKAAPNASEVISYGMPAFRQNRVLVYFAGYKNHIGFYPTSVGIKAFEKELTGYKFSKGAIQFPIDQPMPVKFITDIVRFRAMQDEEDATIKKIAKKSDVNPFAVLSAPAQRALKNEGIKTLKQLAQYSEKDLLKLHGLGPSSIPKINEILAAQGLQLKQHDEKK